MADERVTDSPDDGRRCDSRDPPSRTRPGWTRVRRERDDYYDRLLRKTAEFDNYRKRVERERREQADRGGRRPAARSCCSSSTTSTARSRSTPATTRGVVSQGRRADSRQAARPAAQAGRDSRSRRSAPTSTRTSIRPWSTKSSPEHREGEVIGELRRATRSATGCCGRRW